MITLEEELKLFYEISQVLSEAGLEPEAATGTPATSDDPDATVGNVGMQKAYSPEETALINLAAARQQAGGDPNNAGYKSALQVAQNAMAPIIMAGSKKIPSSLLKKGDRDEFVSMQFVKPGFADTLADLGDRLQSGQPTNLNSYFTSALINSAKDTSKKGRKEKNVGGDDDDASSDPITNKADAGETPDDIAAKKGQVELAKQKWKATTGQDWNPGEQPAEQPAAAPEAPEQPAAEAPAAEPAPGEEPAGEPEAPAAPEKAAPRGKKAAIELPSMTADQYKELIRQFAEMPKTRGKPIQHGGKDYGVLIGRGDNVLTDPKHIEKVLSTHLLDKDQLRQDPLHHRDVYGAHGQEIEADKTASAGKAGKPETTMKQLQGTLSAFRKFVPIHLGIADTADKMADRGVSLSKLQKAADAAAADAASDPNNEMKAQQAQQAKGAFDVEAKTVADLKAKSREAHANMLAQHGNEAARTSLAKKARAAKQPAAQAAAAEAPTDASAPAEPAQAAAPAAAAAAAPSLADTPDSVDLAPDAPAPAAAAPTEQPKKTKAPKIPDSERALRQQTNDPNASFTVVPEYETERAKKFTRTAVPSAKAEPRRPEERQAHHVAGDLADAEAEFADLPPEHQHAMHPVGRKLAAKIDQLHKEYKGIRNTGQKLTRSKEKLKLAKKNPTPMPPPAPKSAAPAAPDPNAAPDSPSVDYSLHGANPNESRSLAGRIFNEDMARTYRIVSERIANYLSRS